MESGAPTGGRCEVDRLPFSRHVNSTGCLLVVREQVVRIYIACYVADLLC
jgi:hypothetical protein